MEGVSSVEVDFGAKTASVAMEPGKTLTRQDCEKAFEGTSYKVTSFDDATEG